jgi:hypothetical protein
MFKRLSKFLKRTAKRTYVKWTIWNRTNSAEKVKISETQKMCLSICRTLITHKDSKFLIAPISGKRYIKNTALSLFVIFDGHTVSMTNHVYHYEVEIDDRNWQRITHMFDDKVETIRREYENEIMSQIENSLHKLQEKVKSSDMSNFLIKTSTQQEREFVIL